MSNAGFTTAELTRKHYLDAIRSVVDARPPNGLPFRGYTFVCIRSDDAAVMTAWALGPEDKGSVIHSFLLDDKLWNMRWPRLYQELTGQREPLPFSQEVLDASADRKRHVEERTRQKGIKK
jgi:hypothetical protein